MKPADGPAIPIVFAGYQPSDVERLASDIPEVGQGQLIRMRRARAGAGKG